MFEWYDWEVCRQACLAFLSGENPYSVGSGQLNFFNPFWPLIPLIPLVLLPPITGLILNGTVSILSLSFVAKKLNLSNWEFFLWRFPNARPIYPIRQYRMAASSGLISLDILALLFFCTKPQASLGFIVIISR